MKTGKALEIVHNLATAQVDGLTGIPEEQIRHLKDALDTMEDFIVNNFADEPGDETEEEEDLPAPDDNEAVEFQVTASVKFEYDFTEMVQLMADDEPMSEDLARDIVYDELMDLHPGTNPGNITVHVQNLQELETSRKILAELPPEPEPTPKEVVENMEVPNHIMAGVLSPEQVIARHLGSDEVAAGLCRYLETALRNCLGIRGDSHPAIYLSHHGLDWVYVGDITQENKPMDTETAMRRIFQDIKKDLHYNKHEGSWYWADRADTEPGEWHGPFDTAMEAMFDAVEPCVEESETSEDVRT